MSDAANNNTTESSMDTINYRGHTIITDHDAAPYIYRTCNQSFSSMSLAMAHIDMAIKMGW